MARVRHVMKKEKPVAFPVNVKFDWDDNPSTDAVTGYEVKVDGGAVQAVPPTTSEIVVPIAAAGTHTFEVVALNQWGPSAPTAISVNINPAGKPTNPKVVKAP